MSEKYNEFVISSDVETYVMERLLHPVVLDAFIPETAFDGIASKLQELYVAAGL